MSTAFYLLKVAMCSGILFGYYHLALRNRLFHQWNRFYLLIAVVASVLLPLLRFEVWEPSSTPTPVVLKTFEQANAYFVGAPEPEKTFDPVYWLSVAYLLITIVLFAAIGLSLLRIYRLLKTHFVRPLDGIYFINTEVPGTPFSFLKYVFWNKAISPDSPEGGRILKHELVHVREGHTYDKLFVRIACALFWYNPFFWLIGRELRSIHEFIADKKSIGNADIMAFAQLLLQTAYPRHYQSLINPFFQTSIKRRIAMLTKIQNPKRAYLSRVLALPLLAGTVILFSFRNRVATNEVPDFATLNTAQTITDTIPVKVKKEVSTVDIKTNKEVVVVYTDGSSETLSESAANARGLVHNGGYYNQPASAKVLFRMDTSAKPEPLFILNGKELSRDEMNKLDSKQIASVNVLKGEAAIKAYGDRGKNGVVLISLKEAGNQQDTKFQRNDTAVMQADLKSIHWNQSGEAEINAEKIIVKGYRKPSTNDNKEVVVMGYPRPKTQTSEVVMGKPIVRDSTAVVTVFGKPAMADRNKEVVVVGYAKPRASAQPVFIKAEQPASISQSDWNTFYLQRLRYLEKWMTANADDGEYCVNLSFTVNADGTLSDVVALNDPGYGLAAKVVEQMKYAPRWKPAMQNGKVVISKAGRTTCIVVVKHATE